MKVSEKHKLHRLKTPHHAQMIQNGGLSVNTPLWKKVPELIYIKKEDYLEVQHQYTDTFRTEWYVLYQDYLSQ